MKRLFVLLLLLLVFVSLAPTIFAQVAYEDVVEKIHYTYPRGDVNGKSHEPGKELGAAHPRVKVYIWADLHETYTRQFFQTTFDDLKQRYAKEALFIYVPRAFLDAPESIEVGMIAECTAKQDMFWPNLKVIATKADGLKNFDYLQGVDKEKLKLCLTDSSIKFRVTQGESDAKSLGFNAIPVIVIQNVATPGPYSIKITGAQPLFIFTRAFAEAKGETITPTDDMKTRVDTIKNDTDQIKKDVQEVKQKQSLLSQELEQIKQILASIFKSIHGLLQKK